MPDDLDIRRGLATDLAVCQQIFDEAWAELHERFGIPYEEQGGDPDWLRPILQHFLRTDPDAFLVGSIDDNAVAFGSAFQRDRYWCLSFLFVRPSFQGRGFGRILLEGLMPQDPDVECATVVESFQPVSTGLYAAFGITPRAIKYWLSGVSRTSELLAFPHDLSRHEVSDADLPDIDALDRSILGFARSSDHQWWREADTPSWCYRRRGGLVAYAYIDDGFLGPVLATDEATLAAVVADALRHSDDAASMSINLCGNSGQVFKMLIAAGAKIDPSDPHRYIYCSDTRPLPASYIHHSDWLP